MSQLNTPDKWVDKLRAISADKLHREYVIWLEEKHPNHDPISVEAFIRRAKHHIAWREIDGKVVFYETTGTSDAL